MSGSLSDRRRAGLALAGALVVAASVAAIPALQAQELPPLVSSTTTTSTTTTVPASPETSEQPTGSDFSEGASEAPAGAQDAGGDGTAAPAGGIVVPLEAQRIIDSVQRTGPSSNADLLALGGLYARLYRMQFKTRDSGDSNRQRKPTRPIEEN